MNIQFQICGLCILFLLIIFYKSHKNLELYKEKVFYSVLCIITGSLILDILSLVMIHYRHNLPAFFVSFICKTYIVSLIFGACAAFLYVWADLSSEVTHRKIVSRSMLVLLTESIVVYVIPIYIFEEGRIAYTYGPATIAVYIFTVTYILLTLGFTFHYREKINKRRMFAIVLWMFIWMGSAVIQFCHPEILAVGFSGAIGTLVLFVVIENPEANLDRTLGCFNSYALVEYISQFYAEKKNFCVLEISFENQELLEKNSMDAYEIMKSVLHILKNYESILVFKNISFSLVLISRTPENLRAAGREIFTYFKDTDVLDKSVSFIMTEKTDVFSGMEELDRFLVFARKEYEDEKGIMIETNEKMVEKFKEQYSIGREIENALAEDRVEVFLQPIYSNHSKAFTSAEALVRIRKEDGSMLSPGVFIPVAEENGQILELGERVFEKVCAFLRDTDAVKMGIHYIEVNLSVVQCEKENLAERLISIIEKYQIRPEWINLEITETASIKARKSLLYNMNRLIEYGFSFSLDDFGKGESNLMYVVEMPVSIIKLDYDISKAFFQNPKAQHVVRAVVGMAHDMKLNVVAEGIEQQEEIDAMEQEEIDYIQGYFYSRPIPMEDFLNFIRNAPSCEGKR